MKNIANNSIFELASLHARIESDIKTYSHVAEFLPDSFKKELEKLNIKIQNELNKRGL